MWGDSSLEGQNDGQLRAIAFRNGGDDGSGQELLFDRPGGGSAAKLFEFAKTNNDAALNYVQELADERSPLEYIQITTGHAAAQIEVLAEQVKELGALGEDCLRICRAIQEVM
jgi:hypothetical protein